MTNEQLEPMRLADSIGRMDTFTDYQREELNKAAAMLRRLHELYEQARDKAVRMIEANDTWAEKTQWVQDTVQPEELGMHRADVLKQRIDRLVNTLAETHSAYQAKPLADEALLQQALECLERSDTLGWQANLPVIQAIKERLG